MGLLLLLVWLASMVPALLFVASVCAFANKLESLRWRKIWASAADVVIGILAIIGWVVGAAIIIVDPANSLGWMLFYSFLSWQLAFRTASHQILKKAGLLRKGDGRTCESWPRAKLATAFGIALLLPVGAAYIFTVITHVESAELFAWGQAEHLLLWLASMAAALLFVALVSVLMANLENLRQRKIWADIASAVAVIPAMLGLIVGATVIFAFDAFPRSMFPYWLLWVLIFLTASHLLLKRAGLLKKGDGKTCQSWPRTKLASGFLIALAITTGIYSYMDAQIRTEVFSEYTRANKVAMDLMAAKVPDARNARLVYEKAFKAMGDVKALPRWLYDTYEANFDPASQEVRLFLTKHEKTLALLRKAAAMPDYYVPIKLGLFPLEISPHRRAAFLLALDARAKATAGNIRGALENIEAIRAISRHVARTPRLIPVLVAVGMEGIGTWALEHVLAAAPEVPDGVIVLPVRPAVWRLHQKGVQRAMKGEEASMLQQLVNVYDEGYGPTLVMVDSVRNETDKSNVMMLGALFDIFHVFLVPPDLGYLKRFWPNAHKLLALPIGQGGYNKRYFEQHEKKAGTVHGIMMGPYYSMYHSFASGVRGDAKAVLSQLALAATAYKARNGKYPEKLADLAPEYMAELPNDPFGHEPIHMKAMKDGLIIYSVGKNLSDDGGTKDEWQNADIAFYLGSAYTEYRLKPALEEAKKAKQRREKKDK